MEEHQYPKHIQYTSESYTNTCRTTWYLESGLAEGMYSCSLGKNVNVWKLGTSESEICRTLTSWVSVSLTDLLMLLCLGTSLKTEGVHDFQSGCYYQALRACKKQKLAPNSWGCIHSRFVVGLIIQLDFRLMLMPLKRHLLFSCEILTHVYFIWHIF